ncbi:hypothetical protein ABZ617_03955 [Nocardiopsis alba]|uniref:hypothetical protein n=1 Tax=Nocardiopsis alba TaxID=53437 RepID=UPI0033F76EBD
MAEMQEVIEEFSAGKVLPAIRWAHLSAASTSLANHPRREGYNTNRSRGVSLYELTVDRMDRAFQCGNYQPAPAVAEGGTDLLHQGIDLKLPLADVLLPSGLVTRDDVRRSEGWRYGEWRWLRASFKYDQVRKIRWKSLTKQQVAAQGCEDQPPLFDFTEHEELRAPFDTDLARTLVVAQSLDESTGRSQLYLGRPRLGGFGESPWYWLYDLLRAGPEGGRAGVDRTPLAPTPTAPSEVADVPLRLRPTPQTPGKRLTDQG